MRLQAGQVWSIDLGTGRVEVLIDRLTDSTVWYRGPLTGRFYRPSYRVFFVEYLAQFVANTLEERLAMRQDERANEPATMTEGEYKDQLGEKDDELLAQAEDIPVVAKLERVEEAQKYEWTNITEFLRLVAEPPGPEYGLGNLGELLIDALDNQNSKHGGGVTILIPKDTAARINAAVNRVKGYDAAEKLKRLLLNNPGHPDVPGLIKELQKVTGWDQVQFALALVNA